MKLEQYHLSLMILIKHMPNKKQWNYFTTNYKEAWIKYRKSKQFSETDKTLKEVGIKMPYRLNIIQNAFAEGWNASGVETKVLKP